MLIALLSDIHANREAFESCLDAATRSGAEKLVILGDIVGYGADPDWCASKVMELAERGAMVIRGNHDQAAAGPNGTMNPVAQIAIDWTRNQLSAGQRAYLGALPLEIREDDRLYVHADASAPARWNYVLDSDGARRHFAACPEKVSFCGHVHRPALYGLSGADKLTSFTPKAAVAIPLLAQRRWLAVMGSVGQPRDDNPAAAWGLYDTASRNLTYMRTAYDVETAAAKVRAAALPESLAARLERGR
jgi:diadenosine tetraphosphatase ApaH/serine/threonine PP2A family protein phosphatase